MSDPDKFYEWLNELRASLRADITDLKTDLELKIGNVKQDTGNVLAVIKEMSDKVNVHETRLSTSELRIEMLEKTVSALAAARNNERLIMFAFLVASISIGVVIYISSTGKIPILQ